MKIEDVNLSEGVSFSELEIDKNDLSKLVEKLTSAGIKETRLNKAIGTSYLPTDKTFTFESFKVEGEAPTNEGDADFRHIKVFTKCGASISLSRLQLSAFLPIGQTAEEISEELKNATVENRKSQFYLKPNHQMNKSLQGNQAKALVNLIGKKFKAVQVELKQSEFTTDGYDEKSDVIYKDIVSYELTEK